VTGGLALCLEARPGSGVFRTYDVDFPARFIRNGVDAVDLEG